MLPQSRRGILRAVLALGLVLLLLAPPASLAQTVPTTPTPSSPTTPVDPTPAPTGPPNTGPPPPDLVPSDTHITVTDERFPVKLCNTEYNLGYDPNVVTGPQSANARALPTGPFYVRIRVEQNVTVNATTVWVITKDEQARVSAGPAYGQSVEVCWNFTLDAGRYRAIVDVDSGHEISESNEKNNERITTFRVDPTPRPDLQVAQVTVQPKNARPGDTQLFSATIVNKGNANSTLTWVDITDETGLIAHLRLGPLQPLQSSRVVALTHPDQRAPGEYVARVLVDPFNDVIEISKLNNAGSAPYSIAQHPLPDLTLRNVTINGTLTERRGLRIEGDLWNIGNATSQNSTARLFIDEAPARNFTLPYSLASNTSGHFQFFFVLTAGVHSLRVQADPTNIIPELDETNNAWNANVTIERGPADQELPNLIVDRLDVGPLDPSPDEVVNVTGVVHNVGTRRSENTSVSFFIGSKRLGSAHVGPVNPDVSVSFHYAWASPPPGPYELRAWIDPDGLLNETDRSDNNYTIDFDIAPPRVRGNPASNDTTRDDIIENGTGNATFPPATGGGPVTIEPSSANATVAVEIGQLVVSTRAIPGGVKGVITASLRNPSIDPISRMTVTFSIDGQNVKTQLVSNLGGAATTSVTSREIDMPSGSHTVSVEAKVIGSDLPAANVTRAYQAVAGDKSLVPGLPAMGVLGAAALVAIVVGRRKK